MKKSPFLFRMYKDLAVVSIFVRPDDWESTNSGKLSCICDIDRVGLNNNHINTIFQVNSFVAYESTDVSYDTFTKKRFRPTYKSLLNELYRKHPHMIQIFPTMDEMNAFLESPTFITYATPIIFKEFPLPI